MNSEESSNSGSRNFSSVALYPESLNHSLIPEKLNPHKISKQTYANLPLSQKASTNIKRMSSYQKVRSGNNSQVLKNVPISDLDAHNRPCGLNNANVIQQIQAYKAQMEERGKENCFIENLPQIENMKDVEEMYSKSATLKPSLNLLNTSSNTPHSEYQSGNPNKLSRFATFDTIPSSQEYSDERFGRGLNTPKCKTTRHSSHDSDKDTNEESVSYRSDNLGSQTRYANSSARAENSFERDTEVRGPFWNENSYCTTLDGEDAAGCNTSASLTAKKTDSLQDALEDFALFSSANTSPINKMRIEEVPLSEIKPEKVRSIEEELADFNPEINPCAFDSETINFLIMRENEYCPEPFYLKKKQTQINWTMRAILFDWMMEVCMEFGLKRETYHYAINYVDRYLSAVLNVPKIELQLIGVTALYMAAKVEEIYPPRVASFAKSTDGAYNTEQINAMELKMAKALKWLLTPPTLNTWANWYMNQWDLYVERSEHAQNHPLIQSLNGEMIQFKQSNQKSYARFREMMQMIDCAVLDAQTLQYKPRALIASVMYVLLGKYFNQFNSNQMFEQFPDNDYYLHPSNQFNNLFGNFLLYSFGFELKDILPSIQYVATYVKLPLHVDMPKAVKMSKENILEGHFEEFLAFQTHHIYNLQYIKRRPRSQPKSVEC